MSIMTEGDKFKVHVPVRCYSSIYQKEDVFVIAVALPSRLTMAQITLTGMLLCKFLVRLILRSDEIVILFLDEAGISNAFILIMLKA